jgi:hypothetical protein
MLQVCIQKCVVVFQRNGPMPDEVQQGEYILSIKDALEGKKD